LIIPDDGLDIDDACDVRARVEDRPVIFTFTFADDRSPYANGIKKKEILVSHSVS
jgi:hypothetical protein